MINQKIKQLLDQKIKDKEEEKELAEFRANCIHYDLCPICGAEVKKMRKMFFSPFWGETELFKCENCRSEFEHYYTILNKWARKRN